ncbi:hypothetical protein [Gimesia aquarii]|uniref:Uncharacterized protein n=1 Tax=Gimesia aquarii TaxID=2527964 RepID=A0A517VVF0_9PLAN|nr:hypothetical protein [Gimesia aquarii]QDT96975.1 hypothetical protein V144x_24460 [Gimesia aquarii]
MRLLHWLAPVLSIVLISHAYSIVQAQGGYPPPMTQSGMIQPVSYNFPGFAQNAQSMAASPQPNFFQGVTNGLTSPYGSASRPGIPMNVNPQGALNAFPQISPFEKMFQQHRIENNGLWSYRDSNGGKKYFFSTEALFSRYRSPGSTLLGNVGTISYFNLVEDDLIAATDEEFADTAEGLNFFDSTTFDVVPNLNAPGTRLRWGWTNEDESGFEFTGWWLARSDSEWSAIETSTHKPLAENQAIMDILLSPPNFIDPTGTGVVSSIPGVTTAEINTILQQELMNLRSLPLDDGSVNGVSVPYDLDFRIKVVSQAWGTNATWMSTPVIDQKSLKVRSLVGVRYMQVREAFGFVGRDSGLLYSDANNIAGIRPDLKLFSHPTGTDENEDGIIDNAGVVEDDDGGGGGTGTTTAFFAAPLDPVTGLPVTPTTTVVNSQVDTHLAGPEIGIQFDLGGDKFKIWGQTKLGLMANQEEIELSGDNVGMITRADPDDLDRPKALIDPTPDNPNPNAFRDESSHTHVSPIFEQSIFMEMAIFDKVPVLKRMKILEEAKFRFGYTYIIAGEIARPFDSIRWQGMPTRGLFPSIEIEREKWSVGSWSVGIDWHY